MEGAGWFPSKTIFESDKSEKPTYYATQLQSDFKRRSQETNDQLTVRLKAALDFFPQFAVVLLQRRLLDRRFAIISDLANFEQGQLCFSDWRVMKCFEDIGALAAGHIANWEFSARMMRSPFAHIVNTVVDNYPVISFSVVPFHLFEAIVFGLLHRDEARLGALRVSSRLTAGNWNTGRSC